MRACSGPRSSWTSWSTRTCPRRRCAEPPFSHRRRSTRGLYLHGAADQRQRVGDSVLEAPAGLAEDVALREAEGLARADVVHERRTDGSGGGELPVLQPELEPVVVLRAVGIDQAVKAI